MVDQPAAQPSDDAAHCPWCSAALPSDAVDTCPSCGAKLHGETDAALPGVTAIDADAIVRNARMPTSPRRSRLLSWLGGEDTTPDEAPAPPGSLAPPPPNVRREILRLELEAEVANLQAEADSIVAEAEVEAREEGGDEAVDEDVEAEPAPAAADLAPTNGATSVGTDDEVGTNPSADARGAESTSEVSQPGQTGTSASA